jgi:hypothetical protein
VIGTAMNDRGRPEIPEALASSLFVEV